MQKSCKQYTIVYARCFFQGLISRPRDNNKPRIRMSSWDSSGVPKIINHNERKFVSSTVFPSSFSFHCACRNGKGLRPRCKMNPTNEQWKIRPVGRRWVHLRKRKASLLLFSTVHPPYPTYHRTILLALRYLANGCIEITHRTRIYPRDSLRPSGSPRQPVIFYPRSRGKREEGRFPRYFARGKVT